MKKLLLNLNLKDLERDPFNKKLLDKYPGAGWLRFLEGKAEVIGSDKALLIDDLSDYHLLQEEASPYMGLFFRKGAKGFMLICMESILYAWHFYDRIDEYKKHFKHSLTFEPGNETLRFPIERRDFELKHESQRLNKAVCVISNKWIWNHPINNGMVESKSFQLAVRNELHTDRMRVLSYWAEKNQLDVYGMGWDQFLLPFQFKPLSDYLKINRPRPIPAGDKLKVMNDYKYAIAVENTDIRGYYTEKVPEAIEAGCQVIGKGGDIMYFPERYRSFYMEDFANDVLNKLDMV